MTLATVGEEFLATRSQQGLAWESESNDVDTNSIAASVFPPRIAVLLPILRRLGLSPLDIMRVDAAAEVNGTDFQAELLASNLIAEQELFREIAREFQIEYVDDIDPGKLTVDEEDCATLLRTRGKYLRARMVGWNGVARSIFVPCGLPLTDLKRVLDRNPDFRRIICMTSPQALRRAAHARIKKRLADEAQNSLVERYPIYSANRVISAWQSFFVGIGVSALIAVSVTNTTTALIVFHVVFSAFFLACVLLRVVATRPNLEPTPRDLHRTPAAALPFYSVLVALHREAEVVPQLIAALTKIQWPRSKLEIKLVCEADDKETLDAIAAMHLPHHFEVIEVPPGLPRTKPKALSYALHLIKGDYVVLYDAEDRPHPLQLLEALHRFEAGGETLACVQAPLEIANGESGIISLLFAFEYSALFRGLLPWLSGRRVLLPLGGTSNHFRTRALEEVGGWDPYNVTEDADLGLRLLRFGYQTATIDLPTLEDAPESFAIWLPQRTRWFKGWILTWLVHMRSPPALFRQVGFWSFMLTQILYAGLVLSAAVHPWLVVAAMLLACHIFAGEPVTGWTAVLLLMDCFNVVCGYLSFLLLGWYSLRLQNRKSFWRIVLFTPPYWMMMSIAAWRAVWQICRQPHHWEKTPHFRSRRFAPVNPG